MYNIIIFNGETGSFVTEQKYQGPIPPDASKVDIGGTSYNLTVVFFEGKKYLVAHEEDDFVVNVIEETVKSLNLSPMN